MSWKEILHKPNGAHFYWADLHVHTPAWSDFKLPSGCNISNEEWKREFAKKYIEEAKNKNIRILGITEHNDVSWIDYIREAAEDSSVIIFPGFEITANTGGDGVHLLCLFNPDRSTKELDGLLSYFGLRIGKRFTDDGKPIIAEDAFDEILEKVKKENGICIAAHVTSDNGLLRSSTLEGGMRIRCFKYPLLLALQIPSSRDELSKFEKNVVNNINKEYKRDFPIACINSSDAKSIGEIGTKKTYVKLSTFTVEGLRQAFLDWRSRIRLENEIEEYSFSKIVAAKWEAGFLDGLEINFNENMNSIIGGRGTGKTTIIETIRYCLDDEPKTDRNKKDHNQILREVFRSGSKISLLVECHEPKPSRYIIERMYPYDPVVKDENGKERPDLNPKDIFNAEIYGHKEIYEISKDPAFQFALLDRFMDEKIAPLKEQEIRLVKELRDGKNDIIRLKKKIEDANELVQELSSLEEKLERFKDLKIQDKLDEKRKFEKEKHLLQRGLGKIDNFGKALRDFKDSFDLGTIFLEEKEVEHLINKVLLGEAKEIIAEFGLNVNQGIKNLEFNLNKTLNKYKELISQWQVLYKANEEKFQDTLKDLQYQFPSVDPHQFLKIEERIRELRIINTEKERYIQQLAVLEKERGKLLHELHDIRRSQFLERERVKDGLNEKLDRILKIDLIFEGNKDIFKEELRKLRSGVRSEHIDKIVDSDQFSIQKLVKACRGPIESLKELFNIPQNSALNLKNAISEEMLYDFEIMEIPTKAIIQLNIGTKNAQNYKDIAHLSDGQRCTALLTLILLESPNPLLVDQPEEDLDNAFIVENIVLKLRKEKERREFIIATHNANIPVLGDAELIIALQADEKKASLNEGNYGSIDDDNVKTIVEKTLEGGKQAFEMRKEKYGI